MAQRSHHLSRQTRLPSRWSTNLSSKVNLPHAIDFGAKCGAHLVTSHPGIEGERNLQTPPTHSILRCRANSAHIRQSGPDSGLGFQVKGRETFKVFPLRSEAGIGSEAGSYLRRIDFVYHSTLGLRVIKKKKGADRASEMSFFGRVHSLCSPLICVLLDK